MDILAVCDKCGPHFRDLVYALAMPLAFILLGSMIGMIASKRK